MTVGPVQLISLGFDQPDFHGEVVAELERLREIDTIRVIDALAVYKTADEQVEVEHLSNLTSDEAIEVGSKVAALVGLGIAGEEGAEAGAEAGAQAAATDGASGFSGGGAGGGVAQIPPEPPPAPPPVGPPPARPPRGATP